MEHAGDMDGDVTEGDGAGCGEWALGVQSSAFQSRHELPRHAGRLLAQRDHVTHFVSAVRQIRGFQCL